MKKLIVLSALSAVAGLCAAQETGRVISSTPLIQQVGVPRQVCTQEQVMVPAQKSGAGAAMGAIAGGAMGNAVGQGSGRALATMIGVLGGAVVGDRVEGSPVSQLQNVQQCTTQTFYENRTVGYNVVYEFAGKQYSVQMPTDPGPTVRLQITPVGAAAAPAPAPAAPIPTPMYAPAAPVSVITPAPVVQTVAAAPVVYTAPVVYSAPVVYTAPYPVYRPYYYHPPVGVSLNFGYSRHYWR